MRASEKVLEALRQHPSLYAELLTLIIESGEAAEPPVDPVYEYLEVVSLPQGGVGEKGWRVVGYRPSGSGGYYLMERRVR